MAYGDKESKEILQHEWERYWSEQDWRNHIVELQRIDNQRKECNSQWQADKSVHCEFLFQIKNGGMSKDLGVIDPKYTENQFKLEKYKYWKDKNMTPMEKEESNKRVEEIMSEVRSIKIKTI